MTTRAGTTRSGAPVDGEAHRLGPQAFVTSAFTQAGFLSCCLRGTANSAMSEPG